MTSDNDGGTQTEIGRITWEISEVTAASEAGRWRMSALKNSGGGLIDIVQFGWDSTGPGEFRVNHASDDVDFIVFTDDSTRAIDVDASANSGSGSMNISSETFLNSTVILTPSGTQTLSAGDTVLADAGTIRVQGNGGPVTMTSTPTIANGQDGQVLRIIGGSDTNLLTIQSEENLAGSNLQLSGGNDFTFGLNDYLELVYDAVANQWIEASRSGN